MTTHAFKRTALAVMAFAALLAGEFGSGEEQSPPQGTRIVRSTENGHALVYMALPVAHPADRVWQLISDYGDPRVAVDIAEDVRFEGDSSGGVRTIFLKSALGGGSVSELIYDVDPAIRSLHYTLLDLGNSPFADYQGYMKVMALGGKRSVIYYRARVFPTEIPESEAADFAVRNMLAFQKRVNELLAAPD